MKKHSITIKGHRTSYSLEEAFQAELETIANDEKISMARLITRIDTKRGEGENLSSVLRIFILSNLKNKLHSKL